MPETRRMLIADADPIFSGSLADFARREGFEADIAQSGARALESLQEAHDAGEAYALCVCELALPGLDGVELVREVANRGIPTATIVLTAYGTIESGVGALRAGAADFLTKPLIETELRAAIERARRRQSRLAEGAASRARLAGTPQPDAGVIGSDTRMRRVMQMVDAVAPSRTTVLMTGESGTGKSLIASAIHKRSPRREGPYVEISCGSIPETLLESELFGHVKGAFTGAHADKPGRFKAADGGTIFLDEINSASPMMQLKLLRVLQERKFEPVGSSRSIEVDVRVVLATNQPLEELVADGRFRQDLYYRINVIKIELPPLRERAGDIPALAERFLREQANELGRSLIGFSAGAIEALRRYPFPGNVRELRNIVERAAVLAKGQIIERADLPEHVLEPNAGAIETLGFAPESPGVEPGEWIPQTLADAMRGPERRIIEMALEANEWNRQKTADDLGINRTTLYKKMKQLGIDEDGTRRVG
ncbi:MAG: sigma-54 dependent transcriptional regulator [Phycisphaerales bacterium]